MTTKYQIYAEEEDGEVVEVALVEAAKAHLYPCSTKGTLVAEACFDSWEDAKRWRYSFDIDRISELYEMRRAITKPSPSLFPSPFFVFGGD